MSILLNLFGSKHKTKSKKASKGVSKPPLKRVLVLDLDETLVHCVPEAGKGHLPLNITLPSGVVATASLNVRPFAKDLLQAAAEAFEIVVFTAADQFYADPVIDKLDPLGNLISQRLYRSDCTLVQGTYVKDLSILGRNLKDVILVDNSLSSCAFQEDNAVPILSWFDDCQDTELLKLASYLKLAIRVSDVRLLNREVFGVNNLNGK